MYVCLIDKAYFFKSFWLINHGSKLNMTEWETSSIVSLVLFCSIN